MADQHGAYDSSLQPRREGFCEWCCGLPWPEILRVYGFVLGAALVVVGIVSYAKLGDFNVKEVINYAYQIIFGLLVMAAEARLSSPLERISFLQTSFGLGMFYLFLCGLAVGSEAWEIMLAIALSFASTGYFIMSCQGKVPSGSKNRSSIPPPLAPAPVPQQHAQLEKNPFEDEPANASDANRAGYVPPPSAWPENAV